MFSVGTMSGGLRLQVPDFGPATSEPGLLVAERKKTACVNSGDFLLLLKKIKVKKTKTLDVKQVELVEH